MSNIEWTDETWQVTAGCKMVSPGCANCYAETMAKRLRGMAQKDVAAGRDPKGKRPYLHVLNDAGRWNGTCTPIPENLNIPLGWKKPRRIFVNSMSDLFHADVPFEFIDRVFAVMALCPQHTFQVLTKRPERMAEYLGAVMPQRICRDLPKVNTRTRVAWDCMDLHGRLPSNPPEGKCIHWPLPNLWLGTSVEDQARADERIPWLLKCPAAVRFLSVEPMLGAVNIGLAMCTCPWPQDAMRTRHLMDCPADTRRPDDPRRWAGLHWVIVGGESGPGARPCNAEWIRSIVGQGKAAEVPVFVKQLGSRPYCGACSKLVGVRCPDCPTVWTNQSPKGSDPSEWPADLRVREMPGDRT